jgi:hypothetical protein
MGYLEDLLRMASEAVHGAYQTKQEKGHAYRDIMLLQTWSPQGIPLSRHFRLWISRQWTKGHSRTQQTGRLCVFPLPLDVTLPFCEMASMSLELLNAWKEEVEDNTEHVHWRAHACLCLCVVCVCLGEQG